MFYEVSFRELYPFCSTFGTFGVYKYPAKFIPQVVFYALSRYAKNGSWVFDPFAGQGTVGFACQVLGKNYVLWDLIPLLTLLHDLSLLPRIDDRKVHSFLKKLKSEKGFLLPKWSRLSYWHPEPFLEPLGRTYYHVRTCDFEPLRKLLTLAFLKTAKYFSLTDEKLHKLCQTRKSREKVSDLLKRSNLQVLVENYFEKQVFFVLQKLKEHLSLQPKRVFYEVRAPVDSLVEALNREVDVLLTSPPYVQAQEYVRSTTLDLAWLGYEDDFIRGLRRKEVPYRKDVPEVNVKSETYERVLEELSVSAPQKVVATTRRYFEAVVGTLERLSSYVREYVLLFVGRVHAGSVLVPVDVILVEHFTSLGWKWEATYVDKVKGRVLFNNKDYVNPASKRTNKRLEKEYLCVLKRF